MFMSIKLADSQLVMLSAAPQRKDRCLSPRDAHRWLDKLTTDADQTIEALAAREGKT